MLEIEWSYEGKLKHIVIDMSKYIPNTLTKFQHIPSAKPQYTLAHHTLSTCRVKIQYVQLEDEQEEILSDKSVKHNKLSLAPFFTMPVLLTTLY